MGKAVLISIRPEWCELIANGKKTIEVRKNRPKIETPFKCYIYCTHGSLYLNRHNGTLYTEKKDILGNRGYGLYARLNRLVIGEFICENIFYLYPVSVGNEVKRFNGLSDDGLKSTCLAMEEIVNYAGGLRDLYGWQISDVKIYDTPKKLREFYADCCENPKCDGCEYYSEERWCEGMTRTRCNLNIEGLKPVKHPPQSWMYVEELHET